MPITWINGELNGVNIEWLHIEEICEVNDDKELLHVTVSGITDGLNGNGYFDVFQLLKNLTNEKITGSEKVFLLLNQTSGEFTKAVFGAIEDAQIVAAHIVPVSTITGDDTNYMKLRIVNADTGLDICTKTFVTGIDANSQEVTAFGPTDDTAGEIEAGKGVILIKDDYGGGMTLPQCAIILEWDLR